MAKQPEEHRLKITYFFRKKLAGQNSIEELFKGIANGTGKDHNLQQLELPFSGAGPLKVLFNLIYCFFKKTDVNHVTGHVYYLSISLGKASVLTYHDVQSVLRGGRLKRFYLFVFWFWLPCKRAMYITVISEFTKRELLEILPWAKNKIVVVPNAYPNVLTTHTHSSKRDSKSHSILIIGTKPNKNVERIIQSLYGLGLNVIIVGKINEKQNKLLVDSGLIFQNFVDIEYEDIVKLYLNASILCFPSTYEGFGMPIIEAQVLGIPVITSNTGAMKEVAGNGAHLVDPYSMDEIRTGILQIVNNEEYAERLIINGRKNVERFSPGLVTSKYVDIYQKVAGNK